MVTFANIDRNNMSVSLVRVNKSFVAIYKVASYKKKILEMSLSSKRWSNSNVTSWRV